MTTYQKPLVLHDPQTFLRMFVGCPHDERELRDEDGRPAMVLSRFRPGLFHCALGHGWEYRGGEWIER
jgi:hypothetical protein